MDQSTSLLDAAQGDTGSGNQEGTTGKQEPAATDAANVLFGEGSKAEEKGDTEPGSEDGKEKTAEEGDSKDDTQEEKKTEEGEKQEETTITYEDFKLPEGMEYDPELGKEWSELAKKQNLTQEAAQEHVDFYCELQKRAQAQQQKQYADYAEQLVKEAKADPEFGGAKWTEAQRHIAKARDSFAGEDFVKLVQDEPNIGNHPAILRLFYRIGQSIGEDQLISGRAGSGEERRAADVLFEEPKK